MTAAAVLSRPSLAPTAARPRRPAPLAMAALLLPLLLAPLPLACVSAQPRALLAAALATAAAGVLLRALWHRRPLPLPPAALPLSLFAAFVGVQLLPFGGPADVLGDVVPSTLTVLPMRTLPRLLELLALLGLYLAAATLLGHRRRAAAVCSLLVAAAALLAVYGLLLQRGLLPPVDAAQTRSVLVGTYFNRNHFAGLLAMAILAGGGALAATATAPAGARAPRALLLGAAVLTCLLGLFATESRGGCVALLGGAAVFAALAPVARRRWSLLLLAAAVLAALLLVPAGLLQRWQRAGGELAAAGSRADIWRGALLLWRAFPCCGSGLGTFADLSPATQLPHTGGRLEHAHCDPLELLVETGAIGLALLLGAALLFARSAVRARFAAGERDRAWLAAGCTAAVAAIAAHGLCDFNLQVPANTAWFALLAGVASGLHGSRRALPRPAAAAAALLLLGTGAAALLRGLERPDDGMQHVLRGQQLLAAAPAEAAAAARTALQQNPLSPSAGMLLGEALLAQGDPAATAALAHCLRWTDAELRPRRQFEIAFACLQRGQLAAAQRWLQELFAEPRQWPLLLQQLHAAAPAYELLALLVPQRPPALRAALAAELLRSGDFAGRERELATLRGEAAPALLTIADGVRLLDCERQEGEDGPCRTLTLTLRFAVDAGAVSPRLLLHCRGEAAAVARAGAATAAPWQWQIRFDPAFPPGDYVLELEFGDGPRLPLGSVQLPASDLPLALDQLCRADLALYWTTAEPYRRRRPPAGLPLRQGDRLWRDLQLPDGARTLVLRTDGNAAGLQVTFAEAPLAAVSAAGSPVQRFALPAGRRGRLQLDHPGAGEVVVRELFVTGSADR